MMAAAASPAPAQRRTQQRPAEPAPVQAAPSAQPQPQSLPVPDQLTVAKLVWATMAAVDQGNRTGNYSVLRDLGSPTFQASANPATLAAAFANMRNRGLDLSDTFLSPPTYEFAPALVEARVLRARGTFNLRPIGIAFDLLFQWNGSWQIHNIAIAPFDSTRAGAGAAAQR
jgi:hypothetical protein